MYDSQVPIPLDPSDAIPLEELRRARSWSVEYRGIAYDDARQVRGIWFFLDPVRHCFARFAIQSSVWPLGENPRDRTDRRYSTGGPKISRRT